ncbi:hypothetical protein DDQ50_07570 [Amnibacterium flavum]|uniref:Uncharacterized protein n=1 Tax=Amnibacterium flavum TaxID=2173173 RepID=A0A2V1HVA9_9MICO|nr:hypothetical protein DDQ50_07570 [Amnibacterium flavum]
MSLSRGDRHEPGLGVPQLIGEIRELELGERDGEQQRFVLGFSSDIGGALRRAGEPQRGVETCTPLDEATAQMPVLSQPRRDEDRASPVISGDSAVERSIDVSTETVEDGHGVTSFERPQRGAQGPHQVCEPAAVALHPVVDIDPGTTICHELAHRFEHAQARAARFAALFGEQRSADQLPQRRLRFDRV